jgi:hypothetical protein
MTIKEIQDGIVNQIGYLYDGSDSEYNEAPLFAYDIRKCTSLLELVVMLGQYGYDRQGAIGILDGVIITSELVPSLSDEEVNEMIMDEWDRKLDGV